jgi:cysteine desulfuration protein SufE
MDADDSQTFVSIRVHSWLTIGMADLAAKRDALLAELAALPGYQARLEHLMEKARAATVDASVRTAENEIPGCTAQLWIGRSFRDGRCWFAADSDSVVVKAIAMLLCDFYSDAEPGDIVAMDPSFLRGAGVVEHLSANRRNALSKIWERVRGFAEERR